MPVPRNASGEAEELHGKMNTIWTIYISMYPRVRVVS